MQLTPGQETGATGRPEQRSALVVDDELGVRESVALVLECAGFRVVRAKTGAEALATAQRQDCQIVLLDLALPDIPGEELLPRLRHACPGAKVIVITGRLARADALVATEWGVDGLLCKPFRTRDLLACVEGALS